MIRIVDTLAGDQIDINYVENRHDAIEAIDFARSSRVLALDTEATRLNCYARQWQLRTFQFGNANVSYVLPAGAKRSIQHVLSQDIKWIGHNGPHDIRSLDVHLGYETGIICVGETYLPAHHADPRRKDEGGTGHELESLACALIDRNADKWQRALIQEFYKIMIPIEGEVYKSGSRKGQQKYRKCKKEEGWGLIDRKNRAYIAYGGVDPILTFRLWYVLKPIVRQFRERYQFDHRVQLACDKLQRRAVLLDVDYTQRLSNALLAKASRMEGLAAELGCANIYSGQQIAKALIDAGAVLHERTPKGAYKTSDEVLREVAKTCSSEAKRLIRCVLTAKRLTKRAEVYAQAMLRERDVNDRIHPSINSLAARTARMSISKPPLQQLPTKDQESDE